MRTRSLLTSLAASGAFLLTPLLSQQPPSTGLKLSAIPARDASLLADTGTRTYYLYVSAEPSAASQPSGSVRVYKSMDLANWEGPFPVFQVPDGSWAKPTEGVRDPKVYAYRGKYYLFATLSDSESIIAMPPASWRTNTMQGTQVFVGESPQGPFTAVPNSANKPYTPADFVALGGSLYVEGDLAWLIYVHDWTQLIDATVEAVRLKADLSAPAEDAVHLFKASDAPWLQQQTTTSREPRYYPAAGPCVYRTANGTLIMLWSSPREGKSSVVLARSMTGKLRGPWKQAAALLADGSGQATIFRTFEGRLMMIVNQPAAGAARAKLVELEDLGDTLRVKATPSK